MTKTAPMTTIERAGVWIDHRKAQIVSLTDEGELHARLMKYHATGQFVTVETEDKMTDRQIVAKVKAHFGVVAALS